MERDPRRQSGIIALQLSGLSEHLQDPTGLIWTPKRARHLGERLTKNLDSAMEAWEDTANFYTSLVLWAPEDPDALARMMGSYKKWRMEEKNGRGDSLNVQLAIRHMPIGGSTDQALILDI